MYITITPQRLGKNFSKSSAGYVEYLEKENQGLDQGEMEHFFNQHGDEISAEEVVREIDGNTAKLEKHEPRFYSITVNPSPRELKRLENSSDDLKRYTRELMKEYVKCFNREINGRPITVDDVKYFAKIEHQRTFKGTDIQVRENQPYATKILKLKQEIRKIQRGEAKGNIERLKLKIGKLEKQAPHQQNGRRIVQGMQKTGNQGHVHIIVSRKDASNRYSLSPGSKHKASEVVLNGEKVKRGFDRNAFFERAEKAFDKTFKYERNFVETYRSRKQFIKDPKLYFNIVTGLPTNQRAMAFKILQESKMPMFPQIPTNKVQLALKTIKQLKRGVDVAIKSSSIGI